MSFCEHNDKKGGFEMTEKREVVNEKQELNEKIKEMYTLNESLNDSDVKKKHKNVYKKALDVYGEWEKALRGNAVTKRKLKERQRFVLYVLMKSRYNEYGPEALRPKNIDDETKEKIVESYKTLKTLRDIIVNWSEDKAIYELRLALLGGATLENLEKMHPVLYEQMMDHFKDMNDVVEEYDKKFGTPSIAPETLKGEMEDAPMNINDIKLEELAETMVRMNYIEKTEDLFSIEAARHIEKKELSSFIFQKIAQAQQTGEKLSLKRIYESNPVMYFAIKMHYGDLESAVNEITKLIVIAG